MEAPTPPALSPGVRALFQATIDHLLDDVSALFDDLHEAVAASAPDALSADPALAAEIERSNATILAAWLHANRELPGAPVAPVLDGDTLNIVRDVARRGLEDATYNYFRVGLGVAAQHVLDAAFSVSSDPALLRETLTVMLGSAADYIDRSVAALRDVIEHEQRARATGGWRRLEVVSDLLQDTQSDTASASARLGFELGRPLVACVMWTDPNSGSGPDDLTEVMHAVAQACDARAPLVVQATSASIWAWMATGSRPDLATVRALVAAHPGIRLAIGSRGSGVDGFRRGHFDALQTQRVMHRLGAGLDVATHEDVRVVSLAGAQEAAAGEFIALTLGPLASAPPELRSTLRAVVAAGHDSARVAADLGVHRNTVLTRVRRARALLPDGFDERWIDVALALELDRWLGGDQDSDQGRRHP